MPFELLPGERLDALNDRGLAVIQRPDGYCFSMDAVLLSHFARVRKGERALDLGTGCGVIALLLAEREETLRVDALELDPSAVDRARRSVQGNGLSERVRVFEGDLRVPPPELPRGGYDLAVCNPPYGFGPDTSPERRQAVTEATCTLEDAVRAARSLVRFSGRFACCWPASRLQEAMEALSRHRFAVKRLRAVQTLPGKAPYLCLLEAVSGGKPGLQMEPALQVLTPGGGMTDEARAIYGIKEKAPDGQSGCC